MAVTTQTKANNEIDKGIAGIFLGVEDFDELDFQTYKLLLKEKIAAARLGGSDMDSGDVETLTKEFVRIKKIQVEDVEGEEEEKEQEVKKNRIDAVKFFNKTDETIKKSEELKEKILESTKVTPSQTQQKVSPKLLLPPASPQEDEVEDGQEFKEEVTTGLNDLVPSLDNLQDTMENILGTLKKQMLLDKKEEREEDSLEAKQKRTEREDKLEGKGQKEKDNTKSIKDKVVNPVKGIFDTLMDFFKNILLGGALLFLVNVLKDPQKYLQPFVDALNRVLEFFNGIIRAMNGFIENFNKFVLGPINDFILKPIHSSLNYIEDRINDVLGLFGADPLNNIEDDPPSLTLPKIPEIPPYDPFNVLPEGATTQTPPPVQQSYQGGEVIHNQYVTNNVTNIKRYEEGGNVTNNDADNLTLVNNSVNSGGVNNTMSNTMGNTINNIGGMTMGGVNNTMSNTMGNTINNIGGMAMGGVKNTMSSMTKNIGGNLTNTMGGMTSNVGGMTNNVGGMTIGGMTNNVGGMTMGGMTNTMGDMTIGGANITDGMTQSINDVTMGGVTNNFGGANITGGNITNNNIKGFEGGGVTSSSGQKITGAGPDTQLIAAQPGEIVMSRGAVNKFGADNLLAMNAAGGGNNTPRMTNNIQMANGGGTVINAQAFSGGGLVGGTAGSPRNPKNRKIFLHWSGGFHNSPSDRYHQIFNASGKPLNKFANYGVDKFEHTGGANTDSVGLAVAAMGHGPPTVPYSDARGWAENPVTSSQVNALAKEAAGIMRAYGQTAADVNKNVMTHGEWERQGVKSGALSGSVQRWDLDSLTPPGPGGDYGHPGGFFSTAQVRSKGGDALRSKIRSFLGGGGDSITDETPKMSMNLERPDGMSQQNFEMFGSMDAEFRSKLASAQIGDKVNGITVTTDIRSEVKRYNLALTKHSQMMVKDPNEIGAGGGGGGSTAAITSAGARQAPGPRVTPNVDAFLLPGSGGVPKNATPTSSAAGGGKNIVPNFSSTDGMNTETLIIKSIYNMVG